MQEKYPGLVAGALGRRDGTIIIFGVTRILDPSDTSTVVMRVISITKGASVTSTPIVNWSRDQTGSTPYAAGSPYTKLDDNLSLNANSSVVVIEIEYTYVSALSGKVFAIPFEFDYRSKRWPRKSATAQLCATADTATCTT